MECNSPASGVERIAKDVLNLVPVQDTHPVTPGIRTRSLQQQARVITEIHCTPTRLDTLGVRVKIHNTRAQ
jgi:hypothetical protein